MIILPLLKRLEKDNFEIGESEKNAIKKITQEIISVKSLILPNIKEKFFSYCDASPNCIGGALKQIRDKEEQVVMWVNRKLLPAEINYTVTEKECLAIVCV